MRRDRNAERVELLVAGMQRRRFNNVVDVAKFGKADVFAAHKTIFVAIPIDVVTSQYKEARYCLCYFLMKSMHAS